jgi:uroporphyrinogen-III synthase
MASLNGKTIAITEARRSVELANLITKLNGTPYVAPSVREVPKKDRGPARAVLEAICGNEIQLIIFLTGVGTRAFLALAEEVGRRESLLQVLKQMFVVARGPKPIAALREAGVRIDFVPEAPTSEGILSGLAQRSLQGTGVAVQLYGEENPFLVDGLKRRGAIVHEIPLYDWALPVDREPMIRLIRDLVAGTIDVIAFTSSPQIKNLFEVAQQLTMREQLAKALRQNVTVAVVGTVCEATLAAERIRPAIQSEKPTMGALIHAIAEFITQQEEQNVRHAQ